MQIVHCPDYSFARARYEPSPYAPSAPEPQLIVDNPEAFVRIFVDAYFAAGVSTAASGGSNAA